MNILRKLFGWKKEGKGRKKEAKPTYIPVSYENDFDRFAEESEEEQKYEVVQRGFGFRKALPFEPTSDEVIYLENEYDENANRCIRENIDFIRECFAKRGLVFVYLPLLGDELKDNADIWRYRYPSEEQTGEFGIRPVASNFMLDYMLRPKNRPMIRPCFARANYQIPERVLSADGKGQEIEWVWVFDLFFLDFEQDDLHDYLEYVCAKASGKLGWWSGACYSVKPTYDDADEAFDMETQRLLKDVKYKIGLLRRKGISEVVLQELVTVKPSLSKLVITKDYRIVLPDYQDMEISMEPLVKSVFLLFLKHAEGINFKCLPDYREELADIYDKVRGKETPRNLQGEREYSKNILNVTDPLNNSINEKCTRIKEAFLVKFQESLAESYYITGKRGEPKKVCLPQELIVWEE